LRGVDRGRPQTARDLAPASALAGPGRSHSPQWETACFREGKWRMKWA
jgi:hypothetical protein